MGRTKKAVQLTGAAGVLAGAAMLMQSNPQFFNHCLDMADRVLMSPQGGVLIVSLLVEGLFIIGAVPLWYVFLKPLLLHLMRIESRLDHMGIVLEKFEQKFEAGTDRMNGFESRFVKLEGRVNGRNGLLGCE